MAVNAACRIIDLGAVELNDLVSSQSYADLVEMQNFVFRDSRSQIYSFAYSGGWACVNASAVFAIFETDIPEGIDQILITSRSSNSDIYFLDLTASAIMTNHVTGAPATMTSVYGIPAPGLRQMMIYTDDPSGSINAILIEWDAQTIP